MMNFPHKLHCIALACDSLCWITLHTHTLHHIASHYITIRDTAYTSGTASGVGGSFKHRKPIGELGCCESKMAERLHCWIDKWLDCRAAHPPIYPCLYSSNPCIHASIQPSIHLPICLSTYLPIYLSTYLPIYLSIYLI